MDNSNFTHAYIVAGPLAAARELAAAMLCESAGPRPCGTCVHCRKALRGTHTDIELITPGDKPQIPIERVRSVVRAAYVAPNEADVRVFIFDGADKTLRTDAQNALLKLLEEPPRYARFILRAEEPGALLPTVRSRCRVLRLPQEEPSAPEAISGLADAFFTALTSGAADIARFSFELEKTPRADFPLFIDASRRRVAEYMREITESGTAPLSADTLARILRALDAVVDYLPRNVGAQHIAAKICAELT